MDVSTKTAAWNKLVLGKVPHNNARKPANTPIFKRNQGLFLRKSLANVFIAMGIDFAMTIDDM